jgi:hypothetical protein
LELARGATQRIGCQATRAPLNNHQRSQCADAERGWKQRHQ